MKLLKNSKPISKVSQAFDDDENEGTFSPEIK